MSEQEDWPPSDAKMTLIRRYLAATGVQDRIEKGSFLDRYTAPGGAVFEAGMKKAGTIVECLTCGIDAVRRAYSPHQYIWQNQYEQHIHFKFSVEQLEVIVDFLESPTRLHFRDWEWRMDAYISSNTEDIVEQIVDEAIATIEAV
jgi:hypothetical protein